MLTQKPFESSKVKAHFPQSYGSGHKHVHYWVIQRRPHLVMLECEREASDGFWCVVLEYDYSNEKPSLQQMQIAEKTVQEVIEQVGKDAFAEVIMRDAQGVLFMYVIRWTWILSDLELALDFAARVGRLDLNGFINQAANEVID